MTCELSKFTRTFFCLFGSCLPWTNDAPLLYRSFWRCFREGNAGNICDCTVFGRFSCLLNSAGLGYFSAMWHITCAQFSSNAFSSNPIRLGLDEMDLRKILEAHFFVSVSDFENMSVFFKQKKNWTFFSYLTLCQLWYRKRGGTSIKLWNRKGGAYLYQILVKKRETYFHLFSKQFILVVSLYSVWQHNFLFPKGNKTSFINH